MESAKQEDKVASPVTACSSFVCCLLSLPAIPVWPFCMMTMFVVHMCKLGAFPCHGMPQIWLF